VLNKFNEFIFDKLFEDVNKDLPFKISDRLEKLLLTINHPIAKDIIFHSEFSKNMESITLIDYDDDEIDKFLFSNSSKIYDDIYKKHQDQEKDFSLKTDYEKYNSIEYYFLFNKSLYYNFNRTTIKIGKLIKKIFSNKFKDNGDPGNDIESFVNEIKSIRNLTFNNFDIVEGDDIIKYYNSDSYDSEAFEGSTLGNSCMRHDRCSSYIEFYANNDVKLIIQYSDKDRKIIKGRALLWDVYVDDSEDTKKYMDRIYTIYDYDADLFRKFAIKNKFLFRKDNSSVKIYNPIDDTNVEHILKTKDDIKLNTNYPYMDTLRYLYVNKDNNFLINKKITKPVDNKFIYELSDTYGDYMIIDNNEKIYVEYYGESYYEDDLIWCDYGESWRLPNDAVYIVNVELYATTEYAEDNLYFSEMSNEYLDLNEQGKVKLNYYDEYVSNTFARNNLIYSTQYNTYFLEDDVVSSVFYGYIKKDDAVNVISAIYFDYTDYRIENDGTYKLITYINVDGETITDNVDIEEIDIYLTEVIIDLNNNKTIYMLDEDKDNYFKWKGKYYLNKFKNIVTGQLKLKLEKKNEKVSIGSWGFAKLKLKLEKKNEKNI
jgi:hypothetical protein